MGTRPEKTMKIAGEDPIPAEPWVLTHVLRAVPRLVGEITLTGKNQVSLPAEGLRAVGWQRGDRILVEVIYEDMLLLMRRPASWADAFAGKLGAVFGTHDETIAYLEEERRSWDEEAVDDYNSA